MVHEMSTSAHPYRCDFGCFEEMFVTASPLLVVTSACHHVCGRWSEIRLLKGQTLSAPPEERAGNNFPILKTKTQGIVRSAPEGPRSIARGGTRPWRNRDQTVSGEPR